MTTPDAVNLPDRALGALRRLVGREDVEVRGGQLEAVESLVSDRARVLVEEGQAVEAYLTA